MLEISVTPATGHLLVQLEVQGLSKLPLLLVKAIEVIRTQFERCRHMQQIRRPGAEFASFVETIGVPAQRPSPLSL